MTPPDNEQLSSRPWWVHLCRWLWKGLLWFWGVVLLGISINVGSTWLTSQTIELTKIPLGWLVEHLSITIPIGVSLIALTTLTGLVAASQKVPLPSSSLLTFEQRNRNRFLAKLHYRYADILEHSLQGIAQIALKLQTKPTAVINTTRLRFRQANLPERLLPAGTSILQVYDQTNGEMLILGEPGAGKTTLLLNLAEALCQRANRDKRLPLPVIVNLSSWANMRKPLHEWLGEEISRTYDVPRLPVTQWIKESHILPLLDGLDEVEDSARPACIKAINAFKRQHFVPLVVGSRKQEYDGQKPRLLLHNAVVIQPLDEKQVNDYFKASGKSLSGMYSVLYKNAELRELLNTPLMLHVVTLAYRDTSVQALPVGTMDELRQKVFDQYVQRMSDLQAGDPLFPHRQRIHWLSWLAKQMRSRNQTVFYLEQVQPDWLPPVGWRYWVYEALAVKFYGILIGILVSLFINVAFFGTSALPFLPWGGLIGGLVGGLISDSSFTVFRFTAIARAWRQRWRYFCFLGVRNGLLLGMATGVLFTIDEGLREGVIFGISTGLYGFLLSGMIEAGKIVTSPSFSPGTRNRHRRPRWLIQGLISDHFRLGAIGLLLTPYRILCKAEAWQRGGIQRILQA